ncbi:MAG: DUF362 domain-containing protein [Methanosarcinales archaeon]
MQAKVSIVKCEDYSKVKKAVEKSLFLIGGLDNLIKENDKVLLKVNLLSANKPEEAVTTHPSIVEAMIDLVRNCKGIPIVGDSSGTIEAGGTAKAYEVSGIKKVVEDKGAEFINFETAGFEKINVPNAMQLSEIYLAKPILDADIIISLPKLKTHALTLYTGAVKNFFGCVPHKIRKTAHLLANKNIFGEAVIDIYSVSKPSLAVMDAVVGMEGNGPSGGDPKKVGLIVASYDCVALDFVVPKIIGFDPIEVPTNVAAIKKGIGFKSIGEIQVLGENIDAVQVEFKKPSSIPSLLPSFVSRLLMNFVSVKPHINKSKCKKCNICFNNCPANAIDIGVDKTLKINNKVCIQCYCCHELCPHIAVDLKRSLLLEIYVKIQNYH